MKIRTRILTAEQIKKMPLHNLKAYLKSIRSSKGKLHQYLAGVCDMGCDHPRQPTSEQLKMVKTLDWLTARVQERIRFMKD